MFFGFLDTPGGTKLINPLSNSLACFLCCLSCRSNGRVRILGWCLRFWRSIFLLGSVGCSWAVISIRYIFTIGLFVLPLLVQIWAARTSPSFPLISFFQQVLVSNALWDLHYMYLYNITHLDCLGVITRSSCDIHEWLSSNHASNETRSSVRARLGF